MGGSTELLLITVGNGLGRGARVAVAEVQGRGDGGVGEVDGEAESMPGFGRHAHVSGLALGCAEGQRDKTRCSEAAWLQAPPYRRARHPSW